MYACTRSLRSLAAIATTGVLLAGWATDAKAQAVPPGYDGTNVIFRILAGSNLRTGDKLLDRIVFPLVKAGEVRGAGRCTDSSCPVIYEGSSVFARRSRLSLVGTAPVGGTSGSQGSGGGSTAGAAATAAPAGVNMVSVPPYFDGGNVTFRIMAGSNLRTGDKLLDKIVFPLVKGGDVRGAGRCTEASCPVVYEGSNVFARRSRLTMASVGGGSITRTLRRGDQGPEVRLLQETLNKQGGKLDVDSNYGRGTLAAVSDFQRNKGLESDGVAGPRTLRALGL